MNDDAQGLEFKVFENQALCNVINEVRLFSMIFKHCVFLWSWSKQKLPLSSSSFLTLISS